MQKDAEAEAVEGAVPTPINGMERMVAEQQGDGTMITTVGRAASTLSTQVTHASTSKMQQLTRRRQQQTIPWVDQPETCTFEHEVLGGLTN